MREISARLEQSFMQIGLYSVNRVWLSIGVLMDRYLLGKLKRCTVSVKCVFYILQLRDFRINGAGKNLLNMSPKKSNFPSNLGIYLFVAVLLCQATWKMKTSISWKIAIDSNFFEVEILKRAQLIDGTKQKSMWYSCYYFMEDLDYKVKSL